MLFVATTNIDFYAVKRHLNARFILNVQKIKGAKSFETLKQNFPKY